MKRSVIVKLREWKDTYRKNEFTVKPYLIRDGKTHPVAVICPGGGYRRVCSFVEGHPFAKKLNKLGYHAVVVYYRVRNQAVYPNPQDDLAKAIKLLHESAKEWKLDMNGYSVWGSSAGGHLAGSFGTDAMGYKKYGLPKPGAIILAYPVVTMGSLTHVGSRNYLIGPYPDAEYVKLTSIEKQITSDYPPTFFWWGDQDDTVDSENWKMLQTALEKAGVPFSCKEYSNVGHGVGLGKGLSCEGWIEEAVVYWEKHR